MNIVQSLLRAGHKFRPGTRIKVTSVTIHNTGNPNSTARQERAWLDNPANLNSGNFASWHYVIDQSEIIQAIPDNEMSYHAKSGNRSSIGIEICESGDQQATWNNAVQFTAQLLRRHNLTAQNLRTHRDWTGKNCPRLILPRWNEFVSAVGTAMNPPSTPAPPSATQSNELTVGVALGGQRRAFPGIIQNGRTFVSARALLEALGFTVTWNESTSTVDITPPSSMPRTWL